MRILGIVLAAILITPTGLLGGLAFVLWRRARKSRNRVVVARPVLRVMKGGKG